MRQGRAEDIAGSWIYGHVDGQNPTGAVDVYRKLGFKLAFETEVWEARLQ
jgi:hypothetical protein